MDSSSHSPLHLILTELAFIIVFVMTTAGFMYWNYHVRPNPNSFRVRQLRQPLHEGALTFLTATFWSSIAALGSVFPHPIWPESWLLEILKVGLAIFVVDAEFYWVHWFLHRFKIRTHGIHHHYRNPTPFAILTMHPIEAFFLILPYIPMLMYLNLSEAGWAIQIALVLLGNEILHLSYDPFPKSWTQFWGRWLITPMRHLDHHHNPDANFGLFFTYWDRLMKTDTPI